ncbi:MAG: hypothetical protein A2271_02295 [Candidatus Moranbacteria bacterium RIFOXYA12_FULL_35_19]|nr:MAG: hypothetical protein UR78_C0008G0009 [Candidatus Moranbacteria bacterium GW2011_GWF2_35_39]OGI35371.1 MAG: hypothetical protein A2271_02295 [Candidatus Moranbacteria bacterium RIFOXYA12_FULL_35_19]
MKKNKTALVIFLSILISFIPISPISRVVFSQENPLLEEDYTEITEDFEISGEMEIPEGKTVVVKKGVTITMDNAQVDIEGELIIKGTLNEPVKIKKKDGSYGYFFEVLSGGNFELINADVTGGGTSAFSAEKKSILNTAYAYGPMQGAVDVNGGKFSAQNVNFHDNLIAVSITGSNSTVKVNRSKFLNNFQYEVIRTKTSGTADFRYNWWGNPAGPIKNCEIYNACWPVSGTINSSSWLAEPNFHDPVIIVPGILGSQEINGKWTIDPVWHTYDNLYKEFADNGYVPEKDLFTFGYDWEKSNIESAELLKIKIQEIKTANNWSKVDIVAHSMGGLLTREYIESENYADDIDQLITLGTPQNGAPEAYLKWDGDAWFWGGSDLYAKRILDQKVKESAGQYADRFDYIHQKPVSSLEQLLPIYSYLQDVENNYEYEIYPSGYPKNEFLENLNQAENIAKLRKVEFDKIIGKAGSDTGTIAGFKIINADMGKFWDHGYPLGFEIPLIGDRGMIKGSEDGTVPYESAKSENIPADEYMEINSVHRNLPTDAQKDVLEFLTGIRPENENRDSMIKDILITSVFSPIDIQIVSPNGQWAGKNINNLDEGEQIDGAYYSGYETENEFLTVPNPENGEYKVITQGTGDGEYRIEIAKISEDDSGVASEIIGEIIGTAENGIQEEKTVEVLENEIITEEKDVIAPTITISSPQNKIYLSDEIVPIDFSITDDSSEVDEEKTKIFLDEKIFSKNEIDMAYLTKGEHNFKISAMDKAGNFKEEIIAFSIQPTIDSIIENVEHYYQNKLITKKATKNYLDAKLRVIKIQKMLYDAINLSPWPVKFKNQLLKNLARNINREANDLIEKIQKEKAVAKNILEPARSVLISNLGEMKM